MCDSVRAKQRIRVSYYTFLTADTLTHHNRKSRGVNNINNDSVPLIVPVRYYKKCPGTPRYNLSVMSCGTKLISFIHKVHFNRDHWEKKNRKPVLQTEEWSLKETGIYQAWRRVKRNNAVCCVIGNVGFNIFFGLDISASALIESLWGWKTEKRNWAKCKTNSSVYSKDLSEGKKGFYQYSI